MKWPYMHWYETEHLPNQVGNGGRTRCGRVEWGRAEDVAAGMGSLY